MKFAKKADLAGLKSEIAKLDINKLETTTVDLSKQSDLVKNKVVKKTEYNWFKKLMLLRPLILLIMMKMTIVKN